jgi:hypothetical protein
MNRPSRDEILRLLDLHPLPDEGGWYRQTYRADTEFGEGRAASTAIYYFLDSDPDCFSAIHRLPSDEVWHFYLGDPVRLVVLDPRPEDTASDEGKTSPKIGGEIILGSDLAEGQYLQYVVPAGVWFGAYLISGGEYALMGTTVAPGFEFSDYEEGSRELLLREYPSSAKEILRLTRV